MGFYDWQYHRNPGDPNDIPGGPDGLPVNHSALGGTTLTMQGAQTREFGTCCNGGFNGAGKARIVFVPDEVIYPDVHDIDNTKQIQVEAWLRTYTTSSQSYQSQQGWVGAKTYNAYVSNQAPGYWWGISNGNLTFHVIATSGTQYYLTDYGGYSQAVWRKLRLVVVPTYNGASQDRDTVRGYLNVGTEASPSWSLIHETIILNTHPAWIPWAHATYNSVGMKFESEMGQSGAYAAVYVDSFDAKVKVR